MNYISHENVYIKGKTSSKQCCLTADIDRLIFDVLDTARSIHHSLKSGLPKCIYQLKLTNKLIKNGFQLHTEKSVLKLAVTQESDRELIIVNDSLIIECVSENAMNDRCQKRLVFDLENNGYANGLLINFNHLMQTRLVINNQRTAIH